MREKTVYPECCPHCGKSIAHLRPVGERTLDAARALCLPGVTTSKLVAQELHTTTANAGMLLHRAVAAGLAAKVKRVASHEWGGAVYIYQPSQRMRAFAPFAYKQWERDQRNAAA